MSTRPSDFPAPARATHTPGPWAAGKNIVTAQCLDGFLVPIAHTHESAARNRDANTRLIAAAPTMLEALREMLSVWAPHPRRKAAADKARAAIAMAEGL